MVEKKLAGYGTWESDITSDLVSSSSIRFDSQIEICDDTVYWIEGRPSEGGRNVIVRRSPDGKVSDVISSPFNARTRVHEYGGGAFIVDHGTVYFSNYNDQCLFRLSPDSFPVQITRSGRMRYADGVIDHKHNRIICVCEDHAANEQEPENFIGAVDIENGEVTRLISGNDFYSSPGISPDGTKLVWLTWNHPNMPWDNTELWTAEFDEKGLIKSTLKLAGGNNDAVLQPEFSPEGVLYFLFEKSGWMNVYRMKDGKPEPMYPVKAEFGSPHWVFGQSAYSFASGKRMICVYHQNSRSYLAILDTETKKLQQVDTPFTSISAVKAGEGYAVLLAGSPTEPTSIVRLDMETGKTEVLRRSTSVRIDPDDISVPEAVEYPTTGGEKAHAFYYKPVNSKFAAPVADKPPLIVISHGGPTSATSSTLSPSIQYWTNRGFAVADVDYGGSTGYGREYRRRLDGNWGIVDVDDCVNCARFFVRSGRVDGNRTIIRGGSAGGYTTLASLAFRYVFRAGASYYGVSDLEALAKDTHKFESRYLDRLIGPYPEQRELYVERSPIHAADKITCPVIFFQGDEDKIVPPDQSKKMADALYKKRIPVAYLLFEEEQHGFRKAENIKQALDAELYFYGKIFEFNPADEIEPVKIDNLW
jgi:dipeptidyl aminopeptidase/acylaminoacyl peptidase